MASNAVGQSSSVPRSSPIRWLWSVTGGHLSVRAPGIVASHVMAQLIYSAITSLDGYVEDSTGGLDWAAPHDEVHACVNDLERPIGTYLYGRRLYDTMVAWDSMPAEGVPAVVADYGEVWRGADKIVYSRTLTAPRSNGPGSRQSSCPPTSGNSRARRRTRSRSAVPSWPASGCGPGWSTRSGCSSTRSWSAAASARCRRTSGSISSLSSHAGSATVSCCSVTACADAQRVTSWRPPGGSSRERPRPARPRTGSP